MNLQVSNSIISWHFTVEDVGWVDQAVDWEDWVLSFHLAVDGIRYAGSADRVAEFAVDCSCLTASFSILNLYRLDHDTLNVPFLLLYLSLSLCQFPSL
jgi:hypothetical protein